MAYVSVDVDLDDFDTDEICSELVRRIKSYGSKQLTEKQKNELKDEVSELWHKLNFNVPSQQEIKIASLDDKMKLDFLATIWDKYNCWQLEERLK